MRKPILSQLLVIQTITILVLAGVVVAFVIRGRSEDKKGGDPDPKPSGGAMLGGSDRGMGAMGRGDRSASDRGDRASASIPVKVARVLRKSIDASLWDSTWLEPETEVDVLTKAAGEIVKLNVEEADNVKQGDVLAEIESNKPQVEYDKAKVEVENTKVAVQNAEIAQEKARLSYENCKQLFERADRMWKQRVLSAEEYDTKKLDCDKAKAEYDKSKLDLETAKLKLSTSDLEMETARLNLEYTKVRSPISGVVTVRGIERGQVVNANFAVFRVGDYDPIIARISVPETELAKIRIGGPVRVEAESMPGKELIGKVSLISPIAETGKVKVKVEIPNPPGLPLRPGMYATLHLVTETHENALVIPKKALVIESDANEVFIAEDILQLEIPADKAEKLKVDDPVQIVQMIDAKSNDAGTKTGTPEKTEKTEKKVDGKVANILPPGEEDEAGEVTIVLPDDCGLQKGIPAKVIVKAGEESGAVALDVESLDPKTRAVKRRVELGFSHQNDVEVAKGLNENERVVTAGNEELKNGSILLVMAEETPKGEVKTHVAVGPPKASSGGGRWGGGAPSPEFFAKMKERVLANEQVKAEFEKRLKADPELNTDAKKFFQFVGEMREKGLIASRRRSEAE